MITITPCLLPKHIFSPQAAIAFICEASAVSIVFLFQSISVKFTDVANSFVQLRSNYSSLDAPCFSYCKHLDSDLHAVSAIP